MGTGVAGPPKVSALGCGCGWTEREKAEAEQDPYGLGCFSPRESWLSWEGPKKGPPKYSFNERIDQKYQSSSL